MIARVGSVLISRPVPLLAVFATLLLAPSLVHAQDEPKNPEKFPHGVSEVTQEDLLSRMPSFFYFDYRFGDTPGKRLWLRVDSKHWIERYPDGMETRFRVLGRATANEKSGTIVVRLRYDPDDSSKEKDDTMQVFIPDKCDDPMSLLFRSLEEWSNQGPIEQKEWAYLGPMQKVE